MTYTSYYSIIAFAIFYFGPIIHFLINYYKSRMKEKISIVDERIHQSEIFKEPNDKSLADAPKENATKLTINKTGDSDLGSPLSLLRLYSIYSHIGLITSTIYLIVVFTTVKYFNDTIEGLNILCYVSITLWILLIFFDVIYSWELRYIRNIKDERSVLELLMEYIRMKPIVAMKVTCWHTKTTVAINDGISIRVDKVIDYEYVKYFEFQKWVDISMDPYCIEVDTNKLTRLNLFFSVKFGDEKTQNKYNLEADEFLSEIKLKHPNVNATLTRVDTIVDNFEYKLALFWDPMLIKKWMKANYYYVFSLIGLTWIYRIFFKRSTYKTTFEIQKEIFIE